jgi:hypothetical protein
MITGAALEAVITICRCKIDRQPKRHHSDAEESRHSIPEKELK